ncbi:hypothetical protein ETAA8_47950 [Anatilimnocola aggregata]|uniref:Uncharacterized protein n=1 Tax=Anatilimnocola aggregata TaxID=2528021 RepID=A0A517YHH3_9BACT|nr:hypothetical protein ETAA8_47950 [Anatilimnocola aggregata]
MGRLSVRALSLAFNGPVRRLFWGHLQNPAGTHVLAAEEVGSLPQ